MAELRWHDLKTEPPQSEECVVLFPQISDVGILYAASNPEYARENALKDGYTHWFPIPKHEKEDEINAYIDKLYADESGEWSLEIDNG